MTRQAKEGVLHDSMELIRVVADIELSDKTALRVESTVQLSTQNFHICCPPICDQ